MDQSTVQADCQAMDKLLAKLSEQQAILDQQNEALRDTEDQSTYLRNLDHGSSSNSLPITPATEAFHTTAPTTRPASATFPESQDQDEVLRLKLQLAQAQTQISKLAEMAQSRGGPTEMSQQSLNCMPSVPSFARESTWNPPDDNHSDTSDPGPIAGFGRSCGIWGGFRNASAVNLTLPSRNFVQEAPGVDWTRPSTSAFPPGPPFPEQQNGHPPSDGYRGGRLTPDSEFLLRRPGPRVNSRFDARGSGASGFQAGFAGAFAGPSQYDPLTGTPMSSGQMTPTSGYTAMTMNLYGGGPPPPGTSLSPHASEFTSKANWKGEASLVPVEENELGLTHSRR